MRGWVFHLHLLLVLANTLILRSESCGTHNHILLSDSRLPHPEGSGPCIYIPQEQGDPVIPFPFSSPPTTRRATVEVFNPTSTRIFLSWLLIYDWTIYIVLRQNHRKHICCPTMDICEPHRKHLFLCCCIYSALHGNGSYPTVASVFVAVYCCRLYPESVSAAVHLPSHRPAVGLTCHNTKEFYDELSCHFDFDLDQIILMITFTWRPTCVSACISSVTGRVLTGQKTSRGKWILYFVFDILLLHASWLLR
jgi:hypothetical protein